MNQQAIAQIDAETADGLTPTRLPTLIEGFLEARGYAVERPRPELFVGRLADRPDGDGATIAVVAPEADGGATEIAAVEALIAAAREAGVTRRIPVVVASKKGIGPAEQSRLNAAGGSILFPLQFVDWYFRAAQDAEEDDPAGVSARLRDVIEENRVRARAPQPYRRLRALQGAAPASLDGRDLFAALAPEMAAFPQTSRLRVISGAAGVGKTVLVAALLEALHRGFNDAKRRANALASRPLLFEPVELGSRQEQTLDELLDALYAGKLASHVPPAAFRWLGEQGYATWIFDGLDEFYRRQHGFFEAIGGMLDAPGSRAQIVICTRDSLFSSADSLRGFLAERLSAAPERTEIYELARWDAEAKRAYVEIRLREDGVREAALERRTGELMGAIGADPSLAELCDLPFYCDLFVTAIQEGRAEELRDEFSLLQSAVDALIDREAGKLSIDWDVFVSEDDVEQARAMADGAGRRGLGAKGENLFADALRRYGQDNLEYLLGAAAHFYRFAAEDSRALGEISVAEWREVLSPSYIDAHLDEDTEERVRLALMQFAFFGRGRDGGGQETIAFVHELIADYLAAKYALSLITASPERPEAWRQAIGQRADIADTVFFRYLRARLGGSPELAAAGRAHLDHPLMTGPAGGHLRGLLDAG